MTRVALLLALVATPAAAGDFTLARTLLNATPAAGDLFGSALALSGPSLLVGARFDDSAGADTGAAYLFDTASGSLRRTFTNPTPVAGDQFGFSVALLGDAVVIAAPSHDTGAPRSGVVYVLDASTGALRHRLPNPAPHFGDKFGSAVAAGGGDVLVGAPYHGTGGSAFVFDAGTGQLVQTIDNPTPGDADVFGAAVAISGGLAAIAAPFDDPWDGMVNGGAVHIFGARSGVLVGTLLSPNARPGDLFGTAVAVDGLFVLVGVPFDGTGAANGGAAYLFDATSGAIVRTFLSPTPRADARFGSSVALRGNLALIGAPRESTDVAGAGRAYLFEAFTGVLLATVERPGAQAGDQFGSALAVEGGTVVAGAPLDDTGSLNSGVVYQFVGTVPLPSTTTSTTTTTSPSTTSATEATTTTSTTATSDTGPTTSTSTTPTTATEPTTSTTTTTTTSSDPGPSGTTSTSLPATTSSTTRSTTTTTTQPDGCAPDCDDGDPCTTDTCDGVCQNVPATGLGGVTCRLEVLDTALHTIPAVELGGRRLTARLRRKVARVVRLVDAARTGRPVLPRAARILAAFTTLLDRAERRGRIGHPTAADLRALSAAAMAPLEPLR